MPLPAPRADEPKDDFIHRCMGDAVMLEEYPDEDQRYRVCENQYKKKETAMAEQWIPIFKIGTWTDSAGNTRDWSEEDLDLIIRKTYEAGEEIPFVIGHPETNSPAWGWAEAQLKRIGEILYAKPKQVVDEFKDMVNKGLFKKISVALRPDMRMQHIGFLGAKPPAVKGLPSVAFEADDEVAIIETEFAEGEKDKAKEAQQARSKKYNIGIKEGGHVTKPGEWDDVADDDFLDPVNYRYPCPDADQTRAAASYWGKPKNQAQYTEGERKTISARLEAKKKKFKIGDYAKEKGGKAMSLKDTLKKVFTKAVDEIPEEDLQIEPRTFSEAEVEAQVEKATKEALEKGKAEGKKEVAAEFVERDRELKKAEFEGYVDGLIKGDDKKGRALSAAKKAGLVEFMLRLDDEETIEFAEGKEKVSMLAQMKAILETLPQNITYSEVATKDKDVDGGNAGEKLSKLAREKMTKGREGDKEMTFRDAFEAAQIENPELAKEYMAELQATA